MLAVFESLVAYEFDDTSFGEARTSAQYSASPSVPSTIVNIEIYKSARARVLGFRGEYSR